MDQHLTDDNFSKGGINADVPLRNTNNEGEKSNKCNQCEYASSVNSRLKSHLKIQSGEKPNKCNQCDYSSTNAGHLRVHLKTHIKDI